MDRLILVSTCALSLLVGDPVRGLAAEVPAADEARTLLALGREANSQGRQVDALEHYRRAVGAADRSGDLALRVETRGSASVPLLGLSRYDEAYAIAEEAYQLSRLTSDLAVRAVGLFNLAVANNHLWNLDRAAALWPDTIDTYRQLGNAGGEARALKQSVETWFALGDFDRAVADGERAAGLLQQAGLGALVAETHARLALSELRRGRLTDAARWAARARDELPDTPPARHLFVHNDLGIVATELGQFSIGRTDFAAVLDRARQLGNVEYEWRAHWGFGRNAVAEGRPADAVPHLQTAISSIERLRQTIPAASLRASFMTNRVGPYETLVEALVAQSSKPDDAAARRALEVAERARGRALADLLAETRTRLKDPALAAVRVQETAFGQRFSVAQKRVADARDASARTAALRELQTLEQDYEGLILRIRRESPSYAALAYPRALSVQEIAGMLAPEEALVEFALAPKAGFAWAIRGDRLVTYRVPGSEEMTRQVRLMQALLDAGDEAGIRKLGSYLYGKLLSPADDILHGASHLVVVPDGALQRLPFAVLRENDRWLIETRAIAIAPSATILESLRFTDRVPAAEPLLAFAAPEGGSGARAAALFTPGNVPLQRLIHAADEVRDAGRMTGASADAIRTDGAATEAALKAADAGRYRIVHFAAHAVVDETMPRRSAVLLGPTANEDGLLQVNEIANLPLNADLVVLAACRSQSGRLVRGEGLLSLSRAFMHAGARAVVAALWSVEDRETAWLMREFYGGLRRGLPPDEALRVAQMRGIRAGGSLGSPSRWGAFVVSGHASTAIFPARRPGPQLPLSLAFGALVVGLMYGGVKWRLYSRTSKRADADVSAGAPARRYSTNQ